MMEQRQNHCKGCMESVQISSEKLERLVEIATRGRESVPDEEYARRMEQCQQCPGLQYGTTCRYCGCLIAVRARLQDSVCPFPLVPKWDSSAAI
ncbi:DUF6171 family protein [Paenibacillus sp. J23TS9]|uniref:DUF6171 family protein n=1 Tax=Paenibacillus sp. J23TS9 TaxID=2807193 RepID=UPI0027953602|nr:DUF6171 family protein [Paenibacillus sp. J23TS9]